MAVTPVIIRVLTAGLAPLHNPRSNLLKVPVSSGVRIEPSRRWVPELRVPRGVPWRRAPVLELDFSKVVKSGKCGGVSTAPLNYSHCMYTLHGSWCQPLMVARSYQASATF